MKKKRKLFRNLAFFIVLIIITFYILLKDQDLFEIFNIISSVKIEFVFIGIISMTMYLMLEAVNIGRTLKTLNEKSSFLKNFKYIID